jgi:two-component system aerobic respiration control sensor histidine kinase ArcB
MSYLNNDLIVKELLNILPNHVFWKDINGIYRGCNKVFAQGLGFSSEEEIIGKSDYDLPIDKKLSDLYRQDDLSVMKSQSPKLNIEEEQTFTNGKKIYLLTSKVPIFDEGRNVVGILGVYIDITQRKVAENELIKSKKNAAEAATRAKAEFLGSISHDMKSPLVGIVSSADIIAYDEQMPKKARDFSTIISDSGKQLESFFTSCLDLSKMEMEEWALRSSVFSIKKLMNEVHSLYLPKAMSSHLTLQVEHDETLPQSVEGHRDGLYRVLLNLVGNALKFTEKGGVTLSAFCSESIDNQNVNVLFKVQDTGVGIPEDKHKIIFEKLRRLTPSYESKIEGSGIGLYIVDQYVKRMGGSIEVNSKVADGSTFIVKVPLKISDHPLKMEALPQFISQPVNTEKFNKKVIQFADIKSFPTNETKNTASLTRILVVEDSDMIQLVTKTLLNEAGFDIDIAASGEEALVMFEPGKYGLIYMDIGLPKMNGYETTRTIREKEKALKSVVQVPIIALTGHGAVDVKKFCGDAGMQGILSKPLSREQAETVWQLYGEHKEVAVRGLTILENGDNIVPEQDILDIELTIKRMGSKEVARQMIADFVQSLETQFLPKFKTDVEKNSREELRFQLHQQLGSVAYVEAPLLRQVLLSVQKAVKSDEELTPALYQELEKSVRQLSKFYKKTIVLS